MRAIKAHPYDTRKRILKALKAHCFRMGLLEQFSHFLPHISLFHCSIHSINMLRTCGVR